MSEAAHGVVIALTNAERSRRAANAEAVIPAFGVRLVAPVRAERAYEPVLGTRQREGPADRLFVERAGAYRPLGRGVDLAAEDPVPVRRERGDRTPGRSAVLLDD